MINEEKNYKIINKRSIFGDNQILADGTVDESSFINDKLQGAPAEYAIEIDGSMAMGDLMAYCKKYEKEKTEIACNCGINITCYKCFHHILSTGITDDGWHLPTALWPNIIRPSTLIQFYIDSAQQLEKKLQ